MKRPTGRFAQIFVSFSMIVFVFARVYAGDGKTVFSSQEPTIESPPQFRFSAEYNIEETYIGDSDVARGRHEVRDFDESNTVVSFILTPRIGIGVLRLGAAYERYSFGLDDGWPLPNTLQAVNLVI